jgi:superfamily I DNA/RNA helicase
MNKIPTRTNLSALNDQQRQAVLSEEKRILVLAGAGSGKTNTLLQKINYLLNDKQVDANSILAITFTKNATNEMIDRMILGADKTNFYKKVLTTPNISQKALGVERKKMLQKYPWLNQISIKTFHGFCYQIMRDEGVHVYDNQFKIIPKYIDANKEFTGNTASETEKDIIQKVTIELCENKEFLILLKRYIIDYLVDHIKEEEVNANAEFRPEGKYFTTLKGEKVRSKSEQFISDWLFRNNIDYKYEHKQRVANNSFHPDFFIPSANIYLEHVSNLSYPTFWKEMELKQAGITCIKTFDKATHNSAIFNQMLDSVIKGRISSDLSSASVLNFHEEFAGFKKELNKFLQLVLDVKETIKNANKSIDEISIIAKKSEHDRVRLFYQVAIPIIKSYKEYCVNSSFLDFDDLIGYSLELFKKYANTKSKYQQRYKYILVDEFQDVNNQQVEFLKELINKDSQLFCVGDDWQSIYGFRGSEIEYILNFKNHFKNPEVITLNLNYRSTDHIVKASNEIIKKNKFQIAKDISAVKKGGSKIAVHYEETQGETKSYIWKKIHEHIEEGISADEILILYRRTAMRTEIKESLDNSGVNVQYQTIHGAKGMEAQVVFILGLNSASGGFPDPWMQDKIYHVIKKTERKTLLEEERRLFYVALTRAKKYLYLMSQKGNVSDFVKDIPNDLILLNKDEKLGVDEKISICFSCNSSIEEHYKFCPECGGDVNKKLPTYSNDVIEYKEFKQKVNALPLKHVGEIDDLIIEARKTNIRAYEPWSPDEDKIFKNSIDKLNVNQLSTLFGRSIGAINSRLKELNINF